MANTDLINYIKQTLAAGFPEEQVKDAIKKQGWPEEDIKAAFQEIKEPKPVTPSFVTAAQLRADTERKTEVKPEIKPPEEKPRIFSSVETLFRDKTELPATGKTEAPPAQAILPTAKPTETRPLAIPVETIKAPEPKLVDVAPKAINYTAEAFVKTPSVERLITPNTTDKQTPIPAKTDPLPKTEIKPVEIKPIETKPIEIKKDPVQEKPKGTLIWKIAVLVLSISIIALATYCLISSPQLLLPLEGSF